MVRPSGLGGVYVKMGGASVLRETPTGNKVIEVRHAHEGMITGFTHPLPGSTLVDVMFLRPLLYIEFGSASIQ